MLRRFTPTSTLQSAVQKRFMGHPNGKFVPTTGSDPNKDLLAKVLTAWVGIPSVLFGGYFYYAPIYNMLLGTEV